MKSQIRAILCFISASDLQEDNHTMKLLYEELAKMGEAKINRAMWEILLEELPNLPENLQEIMKYKMHSALVHLNQLKKNEQNIA